MKYAITMKHTSSFKLYKNVQIFNNATLLADIIHNPERLTVIVFHTLILY